MTRPAPETDLPTRIADLYRQAADAADAGDFGRVDALMADAAQLRERPTSRPVPRRRISGPERTSTRAQAVAALDDMGVPAPPREIAGFHVVRFGTELDVRGLASVRRDERKAYDRQGPTRPAPYLVPALDARFLQPVRGPLTLSSWPLERRVLAATSPRVDHLRLTGRLAELAGRLDGEVGARMLDLAARYAGTVPGAVLGPDDAEPARIRAAVQAELDEIAGPDEQERRQAADRAREQLDGTMRLWGWDERPGLQVVEGGTR